MVVALHKQCRSIKDSSPLCGCQDWDALGTVFLFFFAAAAALHPKAVSLLTATLLLCRCCFLHVASCVAHSRERNKHLTPVSPMVGAECLCLLGH